MFFEDDSDIKVAQFGTGDILMLPGYLTDDPTVGTLSFADTCGKQFPIGKTMPDEEWANFMISNNIKTDQDMNTLIRFVFTNVVSIDSLMDALNDVKEYMMSQNMEKY